MENSTEVLARENIHFVVRGQDDEEIIIEAKVPENLSKRDKKKFNDNKATVKVVLYDNDFLDRVSSIPYTDEEPQTPTIKNALSKFLNVLILK